MIRKKLEENMMPKLKVWSMIKSLKALKGSFDKVVWELLGIAISCVGLFSSLLQVSSGTKYYTILDRDFKLEKADFVNGYLSCWFLFIAGVGIILAVICKVFDLGSSLRRHQWYHYTLAFLLFVLASVGVTLYGASISKTIATHEFRKILAVEYLPKINDFEKVIQNNWLKVNETNIKGEKRLELQKRNRNDVVDQLQYVNDLAEFNFELGVDTVAYLSEIRMALETTGR